MKFDWEAGALCFVMGISAGTFYAVHEMTKAVEKLKRDVEEIRWRAIPSLKADHEDLRYRVDNPKWREKSNA